jgi:hypothetical protein
MPRMIDDTLSQVRSTVEQRVGEIDEEVITAEAPIAKAPARAIRRRLLPSDAWL